MTALPESFSDRMQSARDRAASDRSRGRTPPRRQPGPTGYDGRNESAYYAGAAAERAECEAEIAELRARLEAASDRAASDRLEGWTLTDDSEDPCAALAWSAEPPTVIARPTCPIPRVPSDRLNEAWDAFLGVLRAA